MPFGFLCMLKGEVGEVRSEESFWRTTGGNEVDLGGQRVLSLSSTRAVIDGGDIVFSVVVLAGSLLTWRYEPRSCSGSWVNVGMVR